LFLFAKKRRNMSRRRPAAAANEGKFDVEDEDLVMDNEIDEEEEENKIQVCQGQTDEERRDIRKKQRTLFKDMEETNIEVDEARGRNNEIYKKVRYTREAVLDGENLIVIANKAAKKVDKLMQVRSTKEKFTDAET
jgi:hypothetical protein